MKQTSIILTVLAIFSLAFIYNDFSDQTQDLKVFNQWKQTYQIQFKNYYQDKYRFYLFLKNYHTILEHNLKPNQPYNLGINQFSAMTASQFKKQYLNSYQVNLVVETNFNKQQTLGDVDWVAKGAVTPVKNMGVLPNSVLYVTTPTLQTLYWLQYKNLKIFSEQYLMDCCGSNLNLDQVYQCVKTKGITTQPYPFTGLQGACTKSGDFFIGSYQTVKGCDAVSQKLSMNTLSVYVDASNWASYKSGIFSNCGTSLNHLATLVGESSSFWKLKNEWGVSWGQQGFIRLSKGNTCGMCSFATIPYKK